MNKLLAALGTLALGAAFGAGCGATSSTGTAASAATVTTTCGWLMDFNSGAASLVPNSTLYNGAPFFQEGSHAWELCTTPWGGICLHANGGWCMDDHSGAIVLEPADPQRGGELWQVKQQSTGGFRLLSRAPTRRYLCANGGVGVADDGAPNLANCLDGARYDTWFFNNKAPRPPHLTAHIVHRFTSGTSDISNSSCHNEWVLSTSNLDGTSPQTQWVQGGGTTVNGCGWQQRCHIHFGIPPRGDDDGWVDGGWVRSGIVDACNSPDGDGWFVFDFQWKSSNGIVHTVQVSP